MVRKVFIFILSTLTFFALGYFSFPKAYAAINITFSPYPICQDKGKYTLTFMGSDKTFVLGEDYSLGLWKPGADPNNLDLPVTYIDWINPTGTTTYTSRDITIVGERATIGTWYYKLWYGRGTGVLKQEPSRLLSSGSYVMYPQGACDIGLPVLEAPSSAQVNTTIPIKVKNISPDSDYLLWFINGQTYNDGKFPANSIINETIKDSSGNDKNIKTASFNIQLDNNPGTKTLCLKHGKTTLGVGKDSCEISISIATTVQPPQNPPTNTQSSQPGAPLQGSSLFTEPTKTPNIPPPCAKFNNKGECVAVDTAIGEISTEPQGFVRRIFEMVLGLSGGIALILIMISGYKFMTSQGNPEAVKAATEQLTAAIIGLLFIILSFVILQIIGVDILQIPGFAK